MNLPRWFRRPCPPACLAVVLAAGSVMGVRTLNAEEIEWETIDFVTHAKYQEVVEIPEQPGSYTNAYVGPFPLRLRGVVLNDTEDWLDATADYDDEVHMWQMGGEAEFYIQAVNLPEDNWDDLDFGGTACWMGQNYGNHFLKQDPIYNYTDEEWYAELDRLQIWHPDQDPLVSPVVRAGNLIEIRARKGLHYKGKMNVNEQHNNDPDYDFELVILDEDFGLPTPEDISLSAIKDSENEAIFDPDREVGGERYQSTLVRIQGVRFQDDSGWGRNSDLVLVDDTGRSLEIHLGLDESFDLEAAPEDYFDVIGIMDQKAESDTNTDGYRLLVMDAGDFAPLVVPEPTALILLAAAGATLLIGARRRRRR